jgi:hypothetical protein
MSVIKKEPPEAQQHIKGIDWKEVVATLKASPNEFFLLGEFSPGMAAYIRRGHNAAFIPDGESDAKGYMKRHYVLTTRSVSPGGGRVDIYAKFMP